MMLRVGEVVEDRSCVYIKNAQSYVFLLVKHHILSHVEQYVLKQYLPLSSYYLLPLVVSYIASLIVIVTKIFLFCLWINPKALLFYLVLYSKSYSHFTIHHFMYVILLLLLLFFFIHNTGVQSPFLHLYLLKH